MNLGIEIAKRKHKTIYRDGDRTIKLFDQNYSKADILNEALNLARVEETPLLVPNLLEVGMVDGKWAIVTKYIEGVTLQSLMDENPDKLDDYIDMFVDLQMNVHLQRCPGLKKNKEKFASKIAESTLDGNIKWELSMRLEGMPTKNRLCHGDFSPGNIIITDNAEPYILDWAHATQGNASADVARSYLLFMLKGNEVAAEKYISRYCEKSGRDRRYVQKWLPIVAASQSVKNKPEEQEFLARWANVVWYE
jgi:tRNA A-37 threonylcarbamoyl transferase component Bud32